MPAPPEPVFLSVGGAGIRAEVAATPEMLARGLMLREHLAEDSGMLFVFPRPDRYCMWMKDTLVPLSVAFLDSRGRITALRDMRPGSLTQHCAEASASYALEVNAGWFERHGVRVGTVVSGLDALGD